MENATQLQCKALRGLKKSRLRRNNGKQWKKQCAEQSKQSEIRTSVTSGCEPGGRSPPFPSVKNRRSTKTDVGVPPLKSHDFPEFVLRGRRRGADALLGPLKFLLLSSWAVLPKLTAGVASAAGIDIVRIPALGSFGRLGFVWALWLRSGGLALFGRFGFVRAVWLCSAKSRLPPNTWATGTRRRTIL